VLTLLLIGVLAGAVTAVSPCVLPVLPAVFFGAGSITTNGQGSPAKSPAGEGTVGTVAVARRGGAVRIVAGLVLSFAVLTLTGSLLVTALHLPAGVLRWAGLIVLFLAGLGLVVPAVQRVLQHPFTRLPHPDPARAGGPFVLGLALGAVYVPCAGPVIAAIAIAGATGQVDQGVLVLTAAFSIGTAIPLLLFAYAGQLAGSRVSRVRAGARRFRVAGGAVMMALAVALTFNLTDGLQRWAPTYTAAIQDAVEGNDAAQRALQRPTTPEPAPGHTTAGAAAQGASGPVVTCRSAAETLANCGPAPDLIGIDTWINTPDGAPVTIAGLTGKVVLVDFWTFACINCQRAIPHVRAWAEKYKDQGLVVIGVHAPEFAFERKADKVKRAVADLGLTFPIAIDNDFAIWRAFSNQYWPANYFVDAQGRIRFHHFGENEYEKSEQVIQQLLAEARSEAGKSVVSFRSAPVEGQGIDSASPSRTIQVADQ
jgi:cytochrome c biogenesis protein CcdA/thiol-disulfide isomerase/thioredoxin